MKVALGAAAAITGASALLYILLRSRKRQPDLGKHEVPGPTLKTDIPSEVPPDDTKVLSKEAKDPCMGLNGHILRHDKEVACLDDVIPSSDGLGPQEELEDKVIAEVITLESHCSGDNVCDAVAKNVSLCNEPIALSETPAISLATENSSEVQCQVKQTEEEISGVIRSEPVNDKDEVDGSDVTIGEKIEQPEKSEEAQEACKIDTPEILVENLDKAPNDVLESVTSEESAIASAGENTCTQECLVNDDNYSNDRDNQEDIVPVATMQMESLDEQDVPKTPDGEANDSGISSSTNLVSETVVLSQGSQDDCSDDTGKVQTSDSSISSIQDEVICTEIEKPTLTLSSSVLEKLKDNCEVTSSVEEVVEDIGCVETSNSADLQQECLLEHDDGIQQDISTADGESLTGNVSTSPSSTKENEVAEIQSINDVHDALTDFDNGKAQELSIAPHPVDIVPDCDDKQILNWAAEVQEEIAREKAGQQIVEHVSEESFTNSIESPTCTKTETTPVISSAQETVKSNTKKAGKEAPERSKRRRGGKNKNEVSHESKANNNARNKENSQSNAVDSATTDLDNNYQISEPDSQNCDSQSLKSIDSGQGSIEVEPETVFNPSACPVLSQEQYLFYEFEIPQTLVGRLIGKKGAFVHKIKATTDASVIVYPHKDRRLKICSVEGTRQQVDTALRMIRDHFPVDRYPDVTLDQVSSRTPVQAPLQPTVNSQAMQIELTAGVVVEVRVSSIMSGGEMWVQQPLHPSFSALHRLHSCMNLNYGDGTNTPPLPQPIQEGTICVAQVNLQWMRCQVMNATEEAVMAVLLDVGGIISLPTTDLRQIRYDYMTLPFQASQCLLHGIQPVEEDGWSDLSATVLEELVSGTILFSTVVSYTEDGVPLVNLYRRQQDQYVNLNEKMVHLGHAKWIAPPVSS